MAIFHNQLEVRPLTQEELGLVVDYFHASESFYLHGMGVDPKKLPPRGEWLARISKDLVRPDSEKETFYLGWIVNEKLSGHSNISHIKFGNEAFIHLHFWKADSRKQGLGSTFFKMSAEFFARRFKLKRIICEPFADNAGPNNVLKKVGFRFIKKYATTPGIIGYPQDVNRYEWETGTTLMPALLSKESEK